MSDIYIDPYWQALTEWFSGIPLLGQILIIAGAVGILILIVIGVYYLIKGVAYLIYYLFKGIYYLLKAIAKGIYKLFEALYYGITGKEKPRKPERVVSVEENPIIREKTPEIITQVEPQGISFCSECGSKISDSMATQLNAKGQVFCIHCGLSIEAINIHS